MKKRFLFSILFFLPLSVFPLKLFTSQGILEYFKKTQDGFIFCEKKKDSQSRRIIRLDNELNIIAEQTLFFDKENNREKFFYQLGDMYLIWSFTKNDLGELFWLNKDLSIKLEKKFTRAELDSYFEALKTEQMTREFFLKSLYEPYLLSDKYNFYVKGSNSCLTNGDKIVQIIADDQMLGSMPTGTNEYSGEPKLLIGELILDKGFPRMKLLNEKSFGEGELIYINENYLIFESYTWKNDLKQSVLYFINIKTGSVNAKYDINEMFNSAGANVTQYCFEDNEIVAGGNYLSDIPGEKKKKELNLFFLKFDKEGGLVKKSNVNISKLWGSVVDWKKLGKSEYVELLKIEKNGNRYNIFIEVGTFGKNESVIEIKAILFAFGYLNENFEFEKQKEIFRKTGSSDKMRMIENDYQDVNGFWHIPLRVSLYAYNDDLSKVIYSVKEYIYYAYSVGTEVKYKKLEGFEKKINSSGGKLENWEIPVIYDAEGDNFFALNLNKNQEPYSVFKYSFDEFVSKFQNKK